MNLTNSDLLRILALLKFTEEDTPHNFYQALGLTLLLRTLPADELCVAHHFREVQELLRAFNSNADGDARRETHPNQTDG